MWRRPTILIALALDMNLLVHMCRSEPKSAQFALQWLAQELNSMLGERSVDAAQGALEKTLAFELGQSGWPTPSRKPLLERSPEYLRSSRRSYS